MKLFSNKLVCLALALGFSSLIFNSNAQGQSSLSPTVIFTTDAQSPAITGATNVISGDATPNSAFYIRERRNASQTSQRVAAFLNFDVSALTPADVNQAGFSVSFTADYDFQLNDLNSAGAVVGRVTNGAWNGTSTQPLFTWGIDDSADRTTLIADISSLAEPASVSTDVTSIVAGWVNGTLDNYGLAVFISSLESNAAGFSNPQLIVTNALDSDGDGMPDDYEIANGLDPDVNDSGLDDDTDRRHRWLDQS